MPSCRYQTRCAFVLSFIVGCIVCGCGSRKVDRFDVWLRSTGPIEEVVLKSENPASIERVDLTITVVRETDVTKLERHWASWKPKQEKVIEVPPGTGSMQRIELAGTGLISGKRYQIGGTWLLGSEEK
jgi:hypothetical protein